MSLKVVYAQSEGRLSATFRRAFSDKSMGLNVDIRQAVLNCVGNCAEKSLETRLSPSESIQMFLINSVKGLFHRWSNIPLVFNGSIPILLFRLIFRWFRPVEIKFHCKICKIHYTFRAIHLQNSLYIQRKRHGDGNYIIILVKYHRDYHD